MGRRGWVRMFDGVLWRAGSGKRAMVIAFGVGWVFLCMSTCDRMNCIKREKVSMEQGLLPEYQIPRNPKLHLSKYLRTVPIQCPVEIRINSRYSKQKSNS